MTTNKKDAYYFNHYCNARNDRKVRKLRLQLGIEGYGIYFGILENLREQKNFKYPISDLDVLAADLDTSIQKVEVVVRKYTLFEIDENEEFFSPAQVRTLQKWVDIKEMNSLKGIKSGLAKRKKIEDQIKELKALEELSQGNSIKPQLNNGLTTVVLGEETTGQNSTKDLLYYNTTIDIETIKDENELREEWLNDYCKKNGRNPKKLKIHMEKLLSQNNEGAISSFKEWLDERDERIEKQLKAHKTQTINDFDYSLIEGMTIGEEKIIKVKYEKEFSTIHIYFEDGSEHPTQNKEDIYSWYQLKYEEIA